MEGGRGRRVSEHFVVVLHPRDGLILRDPRVDGGSLRKRRRRNEAEVSKSKGRYRVKP